MTQHIVYIRTGIRKCCEHCTTQIDGDNFAESVNHYVEQHGYKIIHIGTETISDHAGRPWLTTVAIIGK